MFEKRRIGMMAAMGHGPSFDDKGRWVPTAEEKIRWLEEYQRDLEQETADVASRIAELRSVADSSTQ